MSAPASTLAPPAGGSSGIGTHITQLDLLRGFIMAVMAIDHVAFFVAKRHPGEFWSLPLPEYPSAVAFLTRAVTHLSAPGFFLLMGAGIALFRDARRRLDWSETRITRTLVSRGLLLLLINQLIENPAWLIGFVTADPAAFWPPPPPGAADVGANVFLATGVLTALGLSMVVGGLLASLRSGTLLVMGIGATVLSQVLTPNISEAGRHVSLAWRIVNVPGETGFAFILYPVLPWLGVTLSGMALGRRARTDPGSLSRLGGVLGTALLTLFLVLRAWGGFGNHHLVPGNGIIDFLNVTKYPPSLTFLTLTLGVNLLLLSVLSRLPAVARTLLDGYGSSPLFFYVAHLWLFMAIGLAFPHGSGYGTLYLAWVVGMIPLYFACLRYTRFKRSKPAGSFWRML